MRVLVLGTGAREHALVRLLAGDPSVEQVLAAPGNPGMALLAGCLPLPGGIQDGGGVADLAEREGADLVVVGPEAPLVAGVADAVRDRGIACFGPSAAAAQLEGSKAFAKQVMAEASVPTASAQVCTNLEQVRTALQAAAPPYVVKDDGLAAGKGVLVTGEVHEAIRHARYCLAKDNGVVVLEGCLHGPEVSLFCLCDGTSVLPLEPAQDFKRLLDGDQGPNTGGMGAYSPLGWAPHDLVDRVVTRIAQPTVDLMARRGTPFRGVLYVGLALTETGPRVIEFNVRFGDPETQVVLARLASPLAPLLMACASGGLDQVAQPRWREGAAVCVVLAAKGYPDVPRKGDPIEGLDRIGPDAYVLHAGTARDQHGRLVSAGGRVLCVVGTGADLQGAREHAYAGVDRVRFAGSQHRRDVGAAPPQEVASTPSFRGLPE